MHEQSQFKDHAKLAQKGEHLTPEPVIIRSSHIGGKLFCCCKTFHAKIDYTSNFVLIVKNSIVQAVPIGVSRRSTRSCPSSVAPGGSAPHPHGKFKIRPWITDKYFNDICWKMWVNGNPQYFFLFQTLILNFGGVCLLVPKYRLLPQIIYHQGKPMHFCT